jgi:hypothetical protein
MTVATLKSGVVTGFVGAMSIVLLAMFALTAYVTVLIAISAFSQ